MTGVNGSPTRLGRAVAVAGAALLAVAVFLPWYSVSITADGAAYARQALDQVAAQYGNAVLQAEANAVGASFSLAAGHQVATLSAHQSLKAISVILLICAALAFLGALLWLAEIDAPIAVDGAQIAAVGVLALLFVLYRMVDRPDAAARYFSLYLSWGVWLALLGGLAIVAGGLLGRAGRPPTRVAAVGGGTLHRQAPPASIWRDENP